MKKITYQKALPPLVHSQIVWNRLHHHQQNRNSLRIFHLVLEIVVVVEESNGTTDEKTKHTKKQEKMPNFLALETMFASFSANYAWDGQRFPVLTSQCDPSQPQKISE